MPCEHSAQLCRIGLEIAFAWLTPVGERILYEIPFAGPSTAFILYQSFCWALDCLHCIVTVQGPLDVFRFDPDGLQSAQMHAGARAVKPPPSVDPAEPCEPCESHPSTPYLSRVQAPAHGHHDAIGSSAELPPLLPTR